MAKKVLGIASIVASSALEPFYTWVAKDEAAELVAAGLIEVNDQLPDPKKKGNVAARPTEAGKAKAAELQASGFGAPAATSAPAEKPTFDLQSDVAIPAITGRGRGPGESIYPFDKMAVGQSFFVAKESKKLASTVSSANARYSEPVLENGAPKMKLNRKQVSVPVTKFTKQFIVRGVTENGVIGSRIWRKA